MHPSYHSLVFFFCNNNTLTILTQWIFLWKNEKDKMVYSNLSVASCSRDNSWCVTILSTDLETFNDSALRLGQNGMMRSSSAVDIAQGATTTTPKRRSSSSLLTARMSSGSTQSLRKQTSHLTFADWVCSMLSLGSLPLNPFPNNKF